MVMTRRSSRQGGDSGDHVYPSPNGVNAVQNSLSAGEDGGPTTATGGSLAVGAGEAAAAAGGAADEGAVERGAGAGAATAGGATEEGAAKGGAVLGGAMAVGTTGESFRRKDGSAVEGGRMRKREDAHHGVR